MSRARSPQASEDREFHRHRHHPDDIDPRGYQRLIANPFLAFACVAFWLGMFRRAHGKAADLLLPIGILVAIFAVWQVQVQCLDCGRTLSFRKARWHACERVMARVEHNEPGRLRLPALGLQLTVLIWLFAIALIFGAIASL